jgi:hypothetical protein
MPTYENNTTLWDFFYKQRNLTLIKLNMGNNQCSGSGTFVTDPDPEFEIRAIRIRFQILTCFQPVWPYLFSAYLESFCLAKFLRTIHKKDTVLYYTFKSKCVNGIFFEIKHWYINIEKKL